MRINNEQPWLMEFYGSFEPIPETTAKVRDGVLAMDKHQSIALGIVIRIKL